MSKYDLVTFTFDAKRQIIINSILQTTLSTSLNVVEKIYSELEDIFRLMRVEIEIKLKKEI